MEEKKTTQEEVERETSASELIDRMFDLFSNHTERMTKKLADIELRRKDVSERMNNGISQNSGRII